MSNKNESLNTLTDPIKGRFRGQTYLVQKRTRNRKKQCPKGWNVNQK